MGLNEVIAGKAVDTFDIEYRTGERREKFVSLLYGLWHRFKKNYALYEIKVEIDNIVQSSSVGMIKEAEEVYQYTLNQRYNHCEASVAQTKCIETHATEKYFETKEAAQRIGEPNINHLTTIEPRQIIASPLKFYDLLVNSHHPCISLVTPRAFYGSKACNEKIVRLIIAIESFRPPSRRVNIDIDPNLTQDQWLERYQALPTTNHKAQARYEHDILHPLAECLELWGFEALTVKQLVEEYDTTYSRTDEKRKEFIKFLKTLGEQYINSNIPPSTLWERIL